MTPKQLLAIVKTLDAGGPIYLGLQSQLRGDGPSKAWYDTQKQHLEGWLGQYDSPGAYDRKNYGNRDAQFFYNHFNCVEGLVWLAEALGVDQASLHHACELVVASGKNGSAQCAAFRREIPWSRIEDRIPSALSRMRLDLEKARLSKARENAKSIRKIR